MEFRRERIPSKDGETPTKNVGTGILLRRLYTRRPARSRYTVDVDWIVEAALLKNGIDPVVELRP